MFSKIYKVIDNFGEVLFYIVKGPKGEETTTFGFQAAISFAIHANNEALWVVLVDKKAVALIDLLLRLAQIKITALEATYPDTKEEDKIGHIFKFNVPDYGVYYSAFTLDKKDFVQPHNNFDVMRSQLIQIIFIREEEVTTNIILPIDSQNKAI